MVRQISIRSHLVTFFLTISIFITGLLLGAVLNQQRLSYLETIGDEQKLEYDSLQTQYLLISTLVKEKNCPGLQTLFYENMASLGESEKKLENYRKDATINKDRYEFLRRDYMLNEVRYWLLSKQVRDYCKEETVDLLYFYAPAEQCADCDAQGIILTYLKKVFGDRLLVFSFDATLKDEPVISILNSNYNITYYPTLIIANKKYEKLIGRDDALKFVCSAYKTKPDACKK